MSSCVPGPDVDAGSHGADVNEGSDRISGTHGTDGTDRNDSTERTERTDRTDRAALRVLATASGTALGALFGAVAAVREGRALHPRGVVVGATVRRLPHPPTGVAWLDGRDDERATVRFSRSAGLPAPLPDVLGLALAVALPDGGRGDLLLSTAGSAPGVRHLLLPRREPLRATYTCLVPYVSDRGAVLLSALPDRDAGLRLAYARPSGRWHAFAALLLDAVPPSDVTGSPGVPDDPALELDPVRNPLPGLRQPAALARLREPAYASSRQRRHAAGDLHPDDGPHPEDGCSTRAASAGP